MNGWRLLGLLSLLLVGMSLYFAAQHGFDVESLRLVIRATARTSLLLFLLAFTAGALIQLVSSEVTRWQISNRRYLGLSSRSRISFISLRSSLWPVSMRYCSGN